MNELTSFYPAALIALGLLVLTTNVIVEVVKQFIPNSKFPTNIVAVIVAVVLTLTVFFAWAAINYILICWYHVAAALVVGFFVSYGAMFGFDKLKEVLEKTRVPK